MQFIQQLSLIGMHVSPKLSINSPSIIVISL